jgi:predicted enzyme related to lactoylglutathione lyase
MSTLHGQFVWYDLMTTDTEAATAFYRKVIGWDAQDAGLPDRSYTVLSTGKIPMGGLMQLPQADRDAGGRPGWSGYILADDVDAYAARIERAGGSIHKGPEDIPGVGRFAAVGDPQGAVFLLFKGNQPEPPPRAAAGTPGHVGWNELRAADQEAAFAFYAELFGWTKAEAINMGPMGVYQIFAIDGVPVGGMMTRQDTSLPPQWGYYINVENTEAAVARVKAAGGQVQNGPMQVPGGSWIAQCLDPQGAFFNIVGPAATAPAAA